ncbi:hypothetical protein CVT26_007795 [Gymnopilus dilepis]|uniref:Uncharacterized protein n=1 Tax=Gymnopilus dilepis TaxID=231916 RepID=A0A409YK08_9AGAR|nr:hypothetical protein CVT26_007795 [Gymnopilus dilepis]
MQNMIRQALHRDYYTWDPHLSEEHISHCVDSIRQSLMLTKTIDADKRCNADISVNVWQWDPVMKSVKGHSTQAHTCKNFEKIWEWTRSTTICHCPRLTKTIDADKRCNADISVNVWQWDPVMKSVKGHSTQAHTCKNFEKIWEWTRERRMKVMTRRKSC